MEKDVGAVYSKFSEYITAFFELIFSRMFGHESIFKTRVLAYLKTKLLGGRLFGLSAYFDLGGYIGKEKQTPKHTSSFYGIG